MSKLRIINERDLTLEPQAEALMVSDPIVQGENGCSASLLHNYSIRRFSPVGATTIASGDRAYSDNSGQVLMNGGGQTYKIQMSIAAGDDDRYVVTIDGSGYINVVEICIPE